MPITINGTGTITGISAGGLPDAIITQPELATGVASTGPAFSAYLNSSQSITNATFTKVQCNIEEFDTNSNYDNATNYRFTPTVAGYYQVNGAVSFGSGTTGLCATAIYKNGTRLKDGAAIGYNTNGTSSTVAALIYFNGSTDYVELYGYQSGGTTTTLTGTVNGTYFQASMVRSA